MRGIARACADDSTGDPGGFRGGWVGEVDVQGRVRPCVMKDTELEKI